MTTLTVTPLDRYLADQQSLTAVERFAQCCDAELLDSRAHSYRDLIPLERPKPGQQYAFEVDLDACTGCKSCVSACHSLNGLDEGESWRSVGLLYGGTTGLPLLQTVTMACHHCVEPACMHGCPVNAYEKDPVTGIVRHLDDQCIGCGYCVLTCPYEVPVFNEERGIVRKCDLCSDRLEAGEAPACVQACPTEAIRVTLVETAAMVEAASAGEFLIAAGRPAPLPGAPPPTLTIPTTRYVTRRDLAADLLAGDHFDVRPGKTHPPLAVMLVLTQLSVGAFVADLALRVTGGSVAPRPVNELMALALGLLALGASVAHLGRPLYAFRAVIGIKRSWLSREIAAFTAFAALATVYAGALWTHAGGSQIGLLLLGVLVGLTGIAGVACSVMIYAVTSRRWWRARVTGVKFALTSAVCGLATVVATSPSRLLAGLLATACATKLGWEAVIFRHLHDDPVTDLGRTARLLSRELRPATLWRFGVGAVGGVLLPLLIVAGVLPPLVLAMAASASFVAVVAGELLERSQFFTACTAPRMPGGLR
ncbi:MAG: DmsC/YnfH family molybdoenzyme membrane anchor subunit [Egibacteraceae bacterium]